MPLIQEPPRPAASSPAPNATLTHPRHTEVLDARMGIRHDEEKQERSKKEHHAADLTLPEDVYDQATLGVRALIDFVKKFLQSLPTEQAADQAAPANPEPFISVPNPSIDVSAESTGSANPYAQMAAQAYARRTSRSSPERAASTTPSTQLLQGHEIRQLHELLDKLNQLDEKGITGLKLNKAETFVQSLLNAADQTLASVR